MKISQFYSLYRLLLLISLIGICISSGGWIGFLIIAPGSIIATAIAFILIRFRYRISSKQISNVTFHWSVYVSFLLLLTCVILINYSDNGDSIGSANFFQRIFNTGYNSAFISPLFFILFAITYYVYLVFYFFKSTQLKIIENIGYANGTYWRYLIVGIMYFLALIPIYHGVRYAINDKEELQGNYYVGLRNGIYYDTPNYSTFSDIPLEPRMSSGFVELVGADRESLQIFMIDSYKDEYAKDKNNVYYRGIKLESSDPVSFRTIEDMGIDANNLYIGNKLFSFHENGIDSESFKRFSTFSDYYLDNNQVFFIDLKNQTLTILKDARPEEFIDLKEGYSKTNSLAYCNGQILPDINVSKFREYADDEIATFVFKEYDSSIGASVYEEAGTAFGDDKTFYHQNTDETQCQKIEIVYPRNQKDTYMEEVSKGRIPRLYIKK